MSRLLVCLAFVTLAIVPAFAAGVADASLAPLEVTVPPAKYRDPNFILYQTGPAVAVAPKGRIWVAIMTGGRDECNLNYVDLLTSGDGGRTWSEPKLALDIDGPLRTFDPAMWTDPEGRVWLFWCQCYDFWDGRGGLWASVCENPDDENAAWSKPRRLCDGVMKDKPLVLANGDRWLFVEQWQDDTQPHVWKALSKLPKLPEWYHTDTPHVGANVYCSKDRGRTWNWLSTVPVPKEIRTCDEHMAVELKDGTFRMLLRVKTGMAESTSADGGRTWTTAAAGSVKNPAGRFFFGRLRSGNILLVKNGPVDTQTDRRDLMAFLSEDDGKTFPYRLELDMRRGVAYPDVSERPDGLIHCVHDYNRRAPGGGIILDVFTEADIKAGKIVSPQGRLHTVVRQNAKPRSAAEIARPIRPGGVDGRPFWNGYSIFFQYPPVLEFKPVTGAARYVAKVYSDEFRSWEVPCGEKPWADLTTVWPKLGANGFVHVVCRGLRVDGTVCGLAGERAFMKTASFTGDYPRAKWSYAEAARRIYDFVFNATPQAEFRRTGKPYPGYRKNCYPAKMDSALIEMCLAYAGIRPERKAEAMKFACTLCDYLMSVSEPAGAPLAHLAPTYLRGFGHPVADAYCAQTMMLEPVKVVMASLRLSQALRRENPALAKKYLDYAEKGAATLAKHQLPDGSWYLRLALKTGRPPELVKSGETSELRFQEGVDLRQNRVFPLSFVTMFDALAEETGKDAYRQAAKRALDYVLREGGPMATYNWEGQFEDGPPTPPYMNLSKHPACDCAIYLLQKFPDDPKRVAEARELARFAEDQFVLWELPVRRDGAIMSPATCPRIGENKPFAWNLSTCRSWHVPGALEQYDCYNPIDASNAKLVRTFLALYRVTKNPLDLEKARAMADSIVNMTPENGDLPTHWRGKWSEQENWTNCMLHAADALVELSQEVEGR